MERVTPTQSSAYEGDEGVGAARKKGETDQMSDKACQLQTQ